MLKPTPNPSREGNCGNFAKALNGIALIIPSLGIEIEAIQALNSFLKLQS